MSYRVLIADDHPLYREALKGVIAAAFSDVEILEAADVGECLHTMSIEAVDLVLLDLSMPDASGLEGLARLRSSHPMTPVIICSALDESATVREAFRQGASGYLPKSSGAAITRNALQIVRDGGIYVPSEAIREITAGGTASEDVRAPSTASGELTPRQWRVLELMEKGLSNKTIGRELGIGEITVKAHVSAILRKLGVDNRVQAVLVARERHNTPH